jgi:hypothetical protein
MTKYWIQIKQKMGTASFGQKSFGQKSFGQKSFGQKSIGPIPSPSFAYLPSPQLTVTLLVRPTDISANWHYH